MKINNTIALELVAGVVVIGAVYYFGRKAIGGAGGLLSGNNTLTANAKDASGNAVTAYQGAGVVGTLGAATNEVSGGWLASFGSWLGIKAYDLTHDDPVASDYKIPGYFGMIDPNAGWDDTTTSYGSTYLSDAAARDARNVYAATDPRRVDGGATGGW